MSSPFVVSGIGFKQQSSSLRRITVSYHDCQAWYVVHVHALIQCNAEYRGFFQTSCLLHANRLPAPTDRDPGYQEEVKLAGWMAEPELLLDSNIRLWVVLPIVFITFLVGVIRHYVSILLQSDKKLTLEQVSDSQVLIRSRILRENGKYIPKQSFLMRKFYFNNQEDGFFKKTKRKVVPPSPMTDPSMLTDMMKGNVTNVLPMILIGGWINWTFSGFVTTKVPFPLTLRFKPMLQQGVELLSLDASWVSSASWYFLNVFGLRSMYSLILGQDNGADQSRIMQEQMSGAAMAMPADTNKAFKGEWEALELTDHQWALESVEEDLMSRELDFDGLFSKELPCGIF
ncbi:ER membrane complex subunit 3 [Dissostichus eleginoides]|nr:ER membrane complex subunit 3 [Dissostichus eleginoides]